MVVGARTPKPRGLVADLYEASDARRSESVRGRGPIDVSRILVRIAGGRRCAAANVSAAAMGAATDHSDASSAEAARG